MSSRSSAFRFSRAAFCSSWDAFSRIRADFARIFAAFARCRSSWDRSLGAAAPAMAGEKPGSRKRLFAGPRSPES